MSLKADNIFQFKGSSPKFVTALPAIQSQRRILVRTKNNPNCVDKDCSICRDDLCSKKFVEKLKCGHYFHVNCIRKWIDEYNNNECPYCRDDTTFIIDKFHLPIFSKKGYRIKNCWRKNFFFYDCLQKITKYDKCRLCNNKCRVQDMDEFKSNSPLPGDNFDNIKELIQNGKDPCLYSVCSYCYDRIDYKNWCSGENISDNMDNELNHYEDIVHFSQDDEAGHADDGNNADDGMTLGELLNGDNADDIYNDNSVSDENSSSSSETSDESSTESIDSHTREILFYFGQEIGNRLVDDFVELVGRDQVINDGEEIKSYFEIKYDDILAFLSSDYGNWRDIDGNASSHSHVPVLSTITEDINVDSEIVDESIIESEYVYHNKIRDDFKFLDEHLKNKIDTFIIKDCIHNLIEDIEMNGKIKKNKPFALTALSFLNYHPYLLNIC
tara:strand:- start:1240 stop:2562 length:1323 start_codon:yes stop_codon:yes gene_type:complete